MVELSRYEVVSKATCGVLDLKITEKVTFGKVKSVTVLHFAPYLCKTRALSTSYHSLYMYRNYTVDIPIMYAAMVDTKTFSSASIIIKFICFGRNFLCRADKL